MEDVPGNDEDHRHGQDEDVDHQHGQDGQDGDCSDDGGNMIFHVVRNVENYQRRRFKRKF